VAGLLGAGLAGMSLAGCRMNIGFERFSDTRTEAATLSDVRLAGDSGSVLIERTSDVHGVEIRRTVHYHGTKPTARKDSIDGTRLVLDTNCGNNCEISYQVRLSDTVNVTGVSDSGGVTLRGVAKVSLKADSGGVRVDDASGDVNIETQSGGVTMNDVKGAVNAKTDSGSVRLNRVAGTVTATTESGGIHADGLSGERTTVRTDSGSIQVTATVAQNVDARSDSGSIRLTVPSGTSYQVKHSTDSGHAQIDVPTDPSSRYLLELRTDSGGITVATG
jgi:hypothetical protein